MDEEFKKLTYRVAELEMRLMEIERAMPIPCEACDKTDHSVKQCPLLERFHLQYSEGERQGRYDVAYNWNMDPTNRENFQDWSHNGNKRQFPKNKNRAVSGRKIRYAKRQHNRKRDNNYVQRVYVNTLTMSKVSQSGKNNCLNPELCRRCNHSKYNFNSLRNKMQNFQTWRYNNFRGPREIANIDQNVQLSRNLDNDVKSNMRCDQGVQTEVDFVGYIVEGFEPMAAGSDTQKHSQKDENIKSLTIRKEFKAEGTMSGDSNDAEQEKENSEVTGTEVEENEKYVISLVQVQPAVTSGNYKREEKEVKQEIHDCPEDKMLRKENYKIRNKDTKNKVKRDICMESSKGAKNNSSKSININNISEEKFDIALHSFVKRLNSSREISLLDLIN